MDDNDKGLDLESALGLSKNVLTLYDELKWMWTPRETIVGTPRAGTPEGTDERNTNIEVNRGAEVIELGKEFYAQVKGLFGLGYPPTERQPVPTVQQGAIAGMSIVTIAIIAVVAYLLFK